MPKSGILDEMLSVPMGGSIGEIRVAGAVMVRASLEMAGRAADQIRRGTATRNPSPTTRQNVLQKNTGRQTPSAARGLDCLWTRYLRLVAAVRSADNLTIPAAPHQLEPTPVGLIGVKLPSNLPVKSPVNALQLPFERLVSE